jgi:hypothetical protein
VGDDRWEDQVGSVAEEAQRLLESFRRSRGGAGTAAAGPDEGSTREEGPTSPDASEDRPEDEAPWVCTDPFCRSCPLCRTVAVVRGLSPETLGRLADLATVAAGVLSDLAAERTRPPSPEPTPADDDDPTAPPRRSRPAGGRVSPIPVRDADEDASRG